MKREFSAELKAAAKATEALLERLVPATGAIPGRLAEAMRYAVLGPGKRLRPFLLIETARLCGAAGAGITRAAAALECVHAYSLVHDDLPAMDDDDMRRGRLTVHRAFDEATAILAGDGLLALAFAILADPATDPDSGIRIKLCARLAAAAGAEGMVGGQQLDIGAENLTPDEAEIRRMQAMKTGALFRYAAEAGAILGRASDSKRAQLAAYGSHLGLAFQIADDLIDTTGTAEAAGKATAKDASRGKATLVAIHGIDGAAKILAATIDEAIASLEPFGERAEVLVEAARFAGSRRA